MPAALKLMRGLSRDPDHPAGARRRVRDKGTAASALVEAAEASASREREASWARLRHARLGRGAEASRLPPGGPSPMSYVNLYPAVCGLPGQRLTIVTKSSRR